MNAKVSFALSICLALILSACAASPQSMLIGKWEIEGSPMKMTTEFKGDGTAQINMLGQTVQGTYTLGSDNVLEWKMNGMSTKAKVKVTTTELELTDDQNRTIKYRKAKQ